MQLIVDNDQRAVVKGKKYVVGIREFLKLERERQGMSQTALARKIGISNVAYSVYETGRTNNLAVGVRAAQALGFDFFMLGSGAQTNPKGDRHANNS